MSTVIAVSHNFCRAPTLPQNGLRVGTGRIVRHHPDTFADGVSRLGVDRANPTSTALRSAGKRAEVFPSWARVVLPNHIVPTWMNPQHL